ncbi:MAG: DUF3124 domain-containing protein [Candidatus Zixiibacteriota bacterium]
MRLTKYIIGLIFAFSILLTVSTVAQDCSRPELSTGQTIYVPAYSHIYCANNERPFPLAVTLSIRNIDQHNAIKIRRVDYYETHGKRIVEYTDSTIVLAPLGSLRYVVPEKDESGGSGANFIVEWNSDKCSNPPIVETIMIGTRGGQGLSFTSRGQAIVDSMSK